MPIYLSISSIPNGSSKSGTVVGTDRIFSCNFFQMLITNHIAQKLCNAASLRFNLVELQMQHTIQTYIKSYAALALIINFSK
jgi:hypothetical protein